MSVIALIENIERDAELMQQWIEVEIRDAEVWRFFDPRQAEAKLEQHKNSVACIVLDMYFPSLMGNVEEAQGVRILDRYPEVPTVLISQRAEARTMLGKKEHVPLLQLDKPANLFPSNQANQLKVANSVAEFRRDLLEAVKCSLLVADLKREIAQLRKSNAWRPLVESRTGKTALAFVVGTVAYGASLVYLPEFVQHLLLAVCAVTGVHLLDRAILVRDFQNALKLLHNRLDELSMERERNRQADHRSDSVDTGQDHDASASVGSKGRAPGATSA